MKQNTRNYPRKLEKLNRFLKRIRIPFRVTFILMGVASTIWFLVRVIPKPSRAAYPCMQAAAPIMSGFVVYLITILASALAFKWIKKYLRKYRFVPAALALLVALGTSLVFIGNNPFSARAGIKITTAIHVANEPSGEGQGIFPGRVIWAWDRDATNENCTNTWKVKNDPTDDDGYFLAKNNDQDVVDSLFSESVKKLTGTSTNAQAWTALFKYQNNKKGIGDLDYATGEVIFIKINQGTAGWNIITGDLSVPTTYNAQFYGVTETLAPLILSVLRELVYDKGVLQQFIYVGDPIAHIYRHNYEYLAAEFPDVNYFDKEYDLLGRTKTAGLSAQPVIHYSDGGEIMNNAVSDRIYKEMEQADYLINIACLKGHERAGITLTAKNHFGSHSRSSAAHLHPGLVWVDKNDWGGDYDLMRTDYGMYRVQVDIMGSQYLGGNTMLFMVDGFWGGPEATMKPVKWKTSPFNNDWSSSLFISQDQVALESVCFDFLRTEFTEQNHPGLAFPNYVAADDYLEQAADSANWPDGILYDPDDSGTPISSLGIHEHWNNAQDKQYSRNLGMDYGIELLTIPEDLVVTLINSMPQATFDTCKHVMHKRSKPVIMFSNITKMFTDPDNQELSYSVTTGNTDHLVATMQGDTAIIVSTGDDFTGSEVLTIHVYDGVDTLHYHVIVDITGETYMEAAGIHPVISYDGIADENIWQEMNWYYIDQVWMPYRASLEANDFSGRYKVAWSESENALCFLVETTDDVFVDNYVYNSNPSIGGNYPDFDILEIFIDEDKSGGMHIFDNGTSNAENAFSYHMAINEPEDGGTVSDLVVCDIAGTNWGYPSQWIPDYASHFGNFVVRRTGHTLTWEFSLKVYNDNYDDGAPEASRVTLSPGKQIGLSLAYCDNDNPFEVPLSRDNFIGTDVGPDEALDNWNEHWQDADVYGTLELMLGKANQPPVIDGSIDDLVIIENNVAYTVAGDLSTVFSDPDEDQLDYTIETENDHLDVAIVVIGEVYKAVVTGQDGFSGSAKVTIKASDGQDTTSLDFNVSKTVSISDLVRLQESIIVLPNPVGNTLRVQMDNELIGTINISILDLSGRVVNRYQVQKTDRFLHYSADFSYAKPGIYLLLVDQGNLQISRKIIH